MSNLEQAVYDLVAPMVDDLNSLNVKNVETVNDNEILLYVYATSNDIARLIGKKGAMASAIRQTMMIASRIKDKRISIKFESY